MSSLQIFLARRRDVLLLGLLAGGFAVLLGELVLYRHWEGSQQIGLVATAVGLAVMLLGLFARGRLRPLLGLLLLALSLSGLMGVREHLEEGGGEAARLPAQASLQLVAYQAGPSSEEKEEEGEVRGERGESAPPPLAPLGLSGLALMGAVILLARPDEARSAG
ncbi:MAG: hypothetical protein ACOYL7_12110 [Caldilinea sp.]